MQAQDNLRLLAMDERGLEHIVASHELPPTILVIPRIPALAPTNLGYETRLIDFHIGIYLVLHIITTFPFSPVIIVCRIIIFLGFGALIVQICHK